MKFRIRVDVEKLTETSHELFTKFLETVNAYVLVSHVLPHGNPHYHMYVDVDVKSDNAMRQRVKRYFVVGAASQYSVSKCDDNRVNEYVQYLFNTKHGNKWELVSSRNFDTNLITTLQTNAKEITDEFEERINKRPSGEKSRLTQFQLGLMVYDGWKALNKEEMMVHELTELAMDVCWKNNQTPEPNKLIKIISVSLSRHHAGRQVLVTKLQNYFQQL